MGDLTVMTGLTTEVGRHHWLRAHEECPAETELQLERCPAACSSSAQRQRSVGTAIAVLAAGNRTELEAEAVVEPVLEAYTAAAEAALGVVELALPAGSWHQPPGTIAPMPPSWLADLAVPEKVPAVLAALGERTAQEVHMVPRLLAVGLERTYSPVPVAVRTELANLCCCLHMN